MSPPVAGVGEGPAGAADGVLALALDPAFLTPADPTSERILDAAVALAARAGTRAVTMDAVAERAGVGRMTVYRRFRHKALLVQAMAVRETRRSLERVAAAVHDSEDVADQFARGFAAALAIAREHPLLAGAEPRELLRSINDEGGRTVELIVAFLAGLIREGRQAGQMRSPDPEAAAEVLFRIGISFLLIPASGIDLEDEEAARRLAGEVLASLVQATG